MRKKNDTDDVASEPDSPAAGGWAALKSATKHLREQRVVLKGNKTLLRMNKPDGFDCPGCAWPDKNPYGSFEYCENGAKAVAWEATAKRATPELFAEHTVTSLKARSDHWLESQGRLTDPLCYNAATDCYERVSWSDALADIGQQLAALPDADQAEYYTSGRTSNEAAFLLQLMARLLGTNNFPDCSNLCHEASSVGLPLSIGVGKGTVTLDDFEHCDAIFSFGHNPGTNHPRMLTTLRDAAKRGADIVVFNPLRERGMQRFRDPQRITEMVTGASTQIATHYLQLKIGGDIAAINGLLKALLAHDDGVDRAFVDEHTEGLAALRQMLAQLPWSDIEAASGLTRSALSQAADIYAKANNAIIVYGMGITQHRHGTDNVRALANLALLKGNIGKRGAGICPVRGHSNVQGDRTMGIWEKPSQAFLNKMEEGTGAPMPRAHWHTVVESIAAMQSGASQVFFAMGGNLVSASPDPEGVARALSQQSLTVSVATKLNRSHLSPGRSSYLLPCLGRTELDLQATGSQSITVEDSMSMVHASRGVNAPASPSLRSECAIVAGIATHALPQASIDWAALTDDYDAIRDLISRSIVGFENFNERLQTPGGFHLPNTARERRWNTPCGRAQFAVTAMPKRDVSADPLALMLTTVRSHDQYNTTIYGLDDRYRGIRGRRNVLFMNAEDIATAGIADGATVDLVSRLSEDSRYRLNELRVVAYAIPRGCCATYFPEANVLIPADHFDTRSSTPGYKSVPVRLVTRAMNSS
ncbi:MAG: FdhF/YdeP family oxidoreductase [Pseudomonadota bacterium]